MKTLYKHQQRFADKDPDKALLCWEGGLGKTIAGCVWLKSNKRPVGARLVICPKTVIGKWKRELIEWGADAQVDVVSRDEVKKMNLDKYVAIIIDECQDFASPLFQKGRSQRATVIYNFVKTHPNAHILELSATPIRSQSWNIHSLACYLGKFWPVKKFRDEFYHLSKKFGRFHYEPNSDWRIKIRPYLEEIADIVLMEECFDIPMQHESTEVIPWTKKQEEALRAECLSDDVSEWHMRHRLENGEEKYKHLEKMLDKYRKVIVVCHFRSQIDDYAERIGKNRQVFVLHGGVKDQDAVIQQAQASDDCVFIIQAGMSSGFDADKFSIMIFCSMSFAYVNYQQMKFRMKRSHNLHENFYFYLMGGKNDEAVFKTIMQGKDFDPLEYMSRSSSPW